nr:LuxR C-terminal-related transcriptional regulator [Flexivirga meconopsidis]
MSAYILTGQTYRFAVDDGHRVRLGWDVSEHPVQDAVVLPLRRGDGTEVIGMIAVESITPDAFDDEFVHAMEWLARALVWEMNQDREFAEDLGLYELYPELDSNQPRNELEQFRLLSGELERLRLALQSVELPATDEFADQRRELDDARAAGERLHLLLVDQHQVRSPERQPAQLESAALTTRELEIATLIAADGLSNRQLATRLFISEKTVKVHVGNVLRKLGVSQRSAIPFVLGEIHPSRDL